MRRTLMAALVAFALVGLIACKSPTAIEDPGLSASCVAWTWVDYTVFGFFEGDPVKVCVQYDCPLADQVVVSTQDGPICLEPPVPAPHASINDFVGSWVNEVDGSLSMPRIQVRVDDETVFVHGWGSCRPTDCDWGEATTDIADAADGRLQVSWHYDWASKHLTITLLPDGRLEVWTFTDFTESDPGRRADFTTVDRFVRE